MFSLPLLLCAWQLSIAVSSRITKVAYSKAKQFVFIVNPAQRTTMFDKVCAVGIWEGIAVAWCRFCCAGGAAVAVCCLVETLQHDSSDEVQEDCPSTNGISLRGKQAVLLTVDSLATVTKLLSNSYLQSEFNGIILVATSLFSAIAQVLVTCLHFVCTSFLSSGLSSSTSYQRGSVLGDVFATVCITTVWIIVCASGPHFSLGYLLTATHTPAITILTAAALKLAQGNASSAVMNILCGALVICAILLSLPVQGALMGLTSQSWSGVDMSGSMVFSKLVDVVNVYNPEALTTAGVMLVPSFMIRYTLFTCLVLFLTFAMLPVLQR